MRSDWVAWNLLPQPQTSTMLLRAMDQRHTYGLCMGNEAPWLTTVLTQLLGSQISEVECRS